MPHTQQREGAMTAHDLVAKAIAARGGMRFDVLVAKAIAAKGGRLPEFPPDFDDSRLDQVERDMHQGMESAVNLLVFYATVLEAIEHRRKRARRVVRTGSAKRVDTRRRTLRRAKS